MGLLLLVGAELEALFHSGDVALDALAFDAGVRRNGKVRVRYAAHNDALSPGLAFDCGIAAAGLPAMRISELFALKPRPVRGDCAVNRHAKIGTVARRRNLFHVCVSLFLLHRQE